ncbi:phosphatidylinositol mannoside acyltransferase [Streptacidiphilus pinicola]|uniref:Phosphatidylinositol mannoside acyltransferase n=1 Tax=Streptacidiphilus pinicola TaxID=2219663 RepID=A0A2X0IZY3_9ACTN|nr:phosphatidylinositol mannoside acyltransferase [Streptacidiphilus pinicola]RAG83506.1 phosphatidylinositol mannoside acyltransferase [Streptacidiphilus pinicola]
MKDQLTYLAYASGWGLVKRLPEPVADALFRRIADMAWRKQGKSVLRLESNLRRVRPDLDEAGIRELSREGMRSYLRYWCESFRMPGWGKERIRASFTPEHIERLDDTLAAGRGVVLALPHMGNWDLAGAWVVVRGYPFSTVAERVKPEKLWERFMAYREGLGMEVLPLTGGAHTMATLAKRLRAGKLVCLVGDRDLSASGIEVDFLGEKTRMPAGPAALAAQTGAALLPVTLWYDETKVMRGCVHEEILVPEEGTRREKSAAMTQAMADVWAAGVREHAKDWHMLQRFWLADLEPRPDKPNVRPDADPDGPDADPQPVEAQA